MDKHQIESGRELAGKRRLAEETNLAFELPDGMDDFDQAVPFIVETTTALRTLARRHDLPFVVYLLEMAVMEASKKGLVRQ
ncbi:hypothetical protein JYU02_01630 [bacterium AH-315-P15]|nr:hypothetical protein [bacterium AH-315-P15]